MESWLEWLRYNEGPASALLTGVLTFITAVYATTTWLTLRLLRKQFEFRIRPIVTFDLRHTPFPDNTTLIELRVRSTNAPARLLSAGGAFVAGASVNLEEFLEGTVAFPVAGSTAPEKEDRSFSERIRLPMGWAYCYVVVQYEDFEGLKKYAEAGEYWFHYIGQDFDPVRWQQKCKQRVEALLGI